MHTNKKCNPKRCSWSHNLIYMLFRDYQTSVYILVLSSIKVLWKNLNCWICCFYVRSIPNEVDGTFNLDNKITIILASSDVAWNIISQSTIKKMKNIHGRLTEKGPLSTTKTRPSTIVKLIVSQKRQWVHGWQTLWQSKRINKHTQFWLMK